MTRAPAADARPITPPSAWRDALSGRPDLPVFDLTAHRNIVVVAAHPDDETLGVGGLLQQLHAAGAALTLVVATDGEAAYPELDTAARRDLATRRRTELDAAMAVQGLADIPVHLLGLPDSALAEHQQQLAAALRPLLADADAYLAPWSEDPHPDHRAAGLATAAAAPVTAHGWSYPIWMWAWLEPDDPAVPWHHAHVHHLDPAARIRRRDAVGRFTSQTEAAPDGAAPVLALGLIDHADRAVDIVFRTPRTTSAPVQRFADLYAGGNDPWRVGSWYERRKRDTVCAALPQEHYATAFEPGCGTGELTAALAPRCTRLLAADPVPAAVERARRTTAGLPGVTVDVAALPDVPPGPLDLVVISEILYYLDEPTLTATLDATIAAMAPGADLLAVHWRGWPAEAPRDAAATHRLLHDRPELEPLVEHRDEEFLLHVLRRR